MAYFVSPYITMGSAYLGKSQISMLKYSSSNRTQDTSYFLHIYMHFFVCVSMCVCVPACCTLHTHYYYVEWGCLRLYFGQFFRLNVAVEQKI